MLNEKIKTRSELSAVCEGLRKAGKTVGFTSGAFDLLHAGHADYLEKAKALCDVLIVGVNSDDSIRKYKGPDRPVVPEQYRVSLVAALQSVDYVFLFDERRNQKNIEALKPHFYIKAGDYDESSLTSAETVRRYGGDIKFIPMLEGLSTSKIIEKLSMTANRGTGRYVERDKAVQIETRPIKPSPAVFLDRDGTIVEETEYLHRPEQMRFLPHAMEGIKQFQDMGFRIVIVTNQPGIGMGYFSKEDFFRVNKAMLAGLSKAGILVDKIYFCPHSKAEKCDCRKPGQALIRRAKEELHIDLAQSYIIGDKTSDLETGQRAGMRKILILGGFKAMDDEYRVTPDIVAEDLLAAAKKVLDSQRT
jgi:D-glycero-beta-D-manno-heptose 1-phosphate adenylyltransferase